MSNRGQASTAHPSSGPSNNEENDDNTNISPPTNAEIIAKLKKASIVGTKDQMCATIDDRLQPLRTEIIRLLMLSSSSTATDFIRLLPVGLLSKKANATSIATTWLGLANCLFALYGYVGGSAGRLTRAETKWVEDVFMPVHNLFQDSISVAVAEINMERLESMKKLLVKLTEKELKRKFLADGATEPDDEALRYCAVCKCRGTVDIPADNKEKANRNLDRIKEHSAAKADWERMKKEGNGNAVREGSKGKSCRAPRIPTLEKVPIVCHCHQMRNAHPSIPDAPGSTCVVQCRDKDGHPYGVGADGKTKCPSCLCNCSAAFEVS